MEFFDSIRQVKTNWQPYKKWEEEQKNKDLQRKELQKKSPASKEELEQASEYGRTLINSISIMDKFATEKAEDIEMASKLALGGINMALVIGGTIISLALLKTPKIKAYLNNPQVSKLKKQIIPLLPIVGLPLIGAPFFTTKFASYEKEGARTAKSQARENELKDPKNFVIYNKEQIAKAKEIAKTLPDPIENKRDKNGLNPVNNYSNSAKSIKSIMKTHDDYLKWKEKNAQNEKNKIENFDKLKATPEELEKAKKTQDNLLRTIKKIEINSQNYLSNVEMAFNMLLSFEVLFGLAIGGAISGATKLLQKSKIISSKSKAIEYVKAYSPIATPIILLLATTSYVTKVKKDAARIGRFKAKQELLNDPNNFISYDEEKMSTVKDIKAPKEKPEEVTKKIKGYFKFLKQLKKDYKEYKNYLKTNYKEEQKLQQALKDIPISKEQKDNSVELQKNTFMSFEKVDEMSQRYVADVEAATDITKQYAVSTANLFGQIAFLYLALKNHTKGKDSAMQIMKYAPILFTPILVQIPIEIKSTQLQKEANKIGIMKATQSLEDPRHFIQKNKETLKTQN